MTQEHVHELITEYVLDLLPPAQRQRVEQHVKLCEQCQRSLKAEQQIRRLLHSTLQKTTAPTPRRLRQLMPTSPHRTKPMWGFSRWHKRLAPAFMVFLLLLGSLGLQLAFPIDAAPAFVNTVLAADVTATITPEAGTAVLIANPLPQSQGTEPAASTLLSTGVATLPPATIATNNPRPAPNPTPIVVVTELTTK